MIGKNKNLLKFHDIDPAELDDLNMTEEEFSYLLMSFTVGGLYYKIVSPNNSAPFENKYPDSYRYRMCKSEYTQNAWPLLEKLMSDSPYKQKIANTIDILKKNETYLKTRPKRIQNNNGKPRIRY